jgi:hypothetical protein
VQAFVPLGVPRPSPTTNVDELPTLVSVTLTVPVWTTVNV